MRVPLLIWQDGQRRITEEQSSLTPLYEKVITPNEQAYLIQPGLSYGMGSFIFDTKHGKAFAHSGFVPGFLSMFAHYPDLGISVALQINCDYASQSLNLIDILNLVLKYK